MRIVGGRFRAKKIETLEGLETRPTSDRTRESLFNILENRSFDRGFSLRGARVLDAFAGTGAFALEALSRGAAHATAIEKNEACVRLIARNAKGIADGANFKLTRGDACDPGRAREEMDLIFLDPPYQAGLYLPCLKALVKQAWVGSKTLCVLEMSSKAVADFAIPDGFVELDRRKYGASTLLFIALASDDL